MTHPRTPLVSDTVKAVIIGFLLVTIASCTSGVKYGVSYTHEQGGVSHSITVERFSK